MARQLLIQGSKTFRITIPDDAKVTFGPWSPPTGEGKYQASEKALNGTLRVYANKTAGATILAVFSGVTTFRDTAIEYAEVVAREEGATIWKSDENGYERTERGSTKAVWVAPQIGEGDAEDAGDTEL